MANADVRLTRRKRFNLAFAATLALLMAVFGLSLHAVSSLLVDFRRTTEAQQALMAIERAAAAEGISTYDRESLVSAARQAADDVDSRQALERLAALFANYTKAVTPASASRAELDAALNAARQATGERLARCEHATRTSASHAILTIIFGSFCAISTGLLAGVTINAESGERRMADFHLNQLTAENDRLAGKAGRRTAACKALLEACREPALIVGGDRHLAACNHAAAKLFHLNIPANGEASVTVRHDENELAPLLSRLLADRALAPVWRGESVRKAEWHWKADGRAEPSSFDVYAEPIGSAADRPAGAVVVLMETTEERKNAERAKAHDALLEAAREQFDLLAAGLASQARPAAFRGLPLGESAAAIARAPRIEPVDLDEVLGDVLTDFEEAIRIAHAVVKAESLPLVAGDRDLLACSLKLLLNRALHSAGELPLLVTVSSQFAADGMCRITIADTSGLELFWDGRQTEAIERDAQVVLCRRIIEKQGGRLCVEAAPDEGTFVHLTLPRAQELTSEPVRSRQTKGREDRLPQERLETIVRQPAAALTEGIR